MENVQKNKIAQYSTFFVAGRMYGVDVTTVQEIVNKMAMTKIPLSKSYIRGLINLRGQIVTAVNLQDLFQIHLEVQNLKEESSMNVICKSDGSLISLLVDQIGDVLEISAEHFESPPSTIDKSIRNFMIGIFKMKNDLISIIDIDKISDYLNKENESKSMRKDD